MLEKDLMLLGALMQKNMDIHEIKKEMDYKDIQNWLKIRYTSIYKRLENLYDLGYVNEKAVSEFKINSTSIYKNLEKNITLIENCIGNKLKNKDNAPSFYEAALIGLYSQMHDTFCSWIEKFEKQYINNSESNAS